MSKTIQIDAHLARRLLETSARATKDKRWLAVLIEAVLALWPELDSERPSPRIDDRSPMSFVPRELEISEEQGQALFAHLVAEASHQGGNVGTYLNGLKLAGVLGLREDFLAVSKPETSSSSSVS